MSDKIKTLNTQYKSHADFEKNNKEFLLSIYHIKEIDSLCKEGILSQKGLADYEFKDAEGIFEYGKHMTSLRNFYKARKSFEICLTINPNHIEANKRFVLNSIFLERYKESIDYLKPLQTSTNIHTRHDFNLWLYLLSYVTELP